MSHWPEGARAGVPWLEWTSLLVGDWQLDKMVAPMPHPSGRCRWWNEPENAARARTFLADALRLG